MTDTRSFLEVLADRVDPAGRPESRLRLDPVAWTHDRLGEETWSGQNRILESLVTHRKTAVKSAHGVGKSHVASRAAAWWLDTNPVGEAFVVSTAPSFAQVRAILWRYIGQAHRAGKLVGRVNQTEWHIGDEIVGYGRKPSDYDEDGFQGIHAPRVLVILDESGGIPEQLWVAVDALVTNDDCRILAIGNPDNSQSHFARVCDPSSGWNVLSISAFDSPNFTGEPISKRLAAQLVSRTWVEEAKRSWGEDSPIYVSKVLAEFPTDAEDGVVPGSAVARCRNFPRSEDETQDETGAGAPVPVQLGVDVGAGGDQSVIRERRGDRAGRVWRSRHADPQRLTGEVMAAILETGATRVCVDSNGVGWGIRGSVDEKCHEAGLVVDVIGVNVGQRSSQPKRWMNLRAELWWTAREGVQETRWDLTDIDDQTAADLTAPRYHLTSRGLIQIESKDEVRKRIGRSPDDADALLLAFYEGGNRRPVLHRAKDLRQPVLAGRPGGSSAAVLGSSTAGSGTVSNRLARPLRGG